MSILTKSFKIDFTQVPNEIINDKNVSLKAKGLYLYMVSKPDIWDFTLSGMSYQLLESEKTILKIIDELCIVGYMEKKKVRIGNRNAPNDYTLHIKPLETPISSSTCRNDTVKVTLSKSHCQNSTTSNTKLSNTKKEIKNNSLSPERREKNFKKFKDFFLRHQSNKPFFTSGLGWLPDTAFIINEDSYILNTVSKKILTSDDAFKVWKYLFANQK